MTKAEPEGATPRTEPMPKRHSHYVSGTSRADDKETTMAKGRQTKTLARISVTASVVDIHGKRFLNWSVTRPLDPKAEKLNMHTTYNGDMQAAVTEMAQWLEKNFAGVA